LSKIPPMQGRFAVSWEPDWCGFWAEASVEMVDRQDRLSPGDLRDTQRIPPDGTPGYTIYNLRLGYRLDERKFFFLDVENIGDKNYRVHGSGSQEAGFNVVVGFDMRF
jgi:hemoglobin/transferrin/lactoferrin receptor protein